jgi:hypothetical protein
MAARKLSKREGTLLGVLGVVAVIVLWVSSGGKSPFSGSAKEQAKKAEPFGDAPQVYMAMLTRDAEPYDPNGRDLFTYSKRPLTPDERAAQAAQRKAADDARVQRAQANAERARAAAAAKPPPPPKPVGPRAPKANFDYLGYLGPKDNMIAVFDRGRGEEELILARTGDVVEEDFLLKQINYQTVVLGYTDERFKNKTQELSMKKGR